MLKISHFIQLLLFFAVICPINLLADDISPVSNVVLDLTNHNANASRSSVINFPKYNQDFTVEAYVFFDFGVTLGSPDVYIFKKDDFFQLRYTDSTVNSDNTYFYLLVPTNESGTEYKGIITWIDDWDLWKNGGWRHISATYNQATEELNLYIDGEKQGVAFTITGERLMPSSEMIIENGNYRDLYIDEMRISKGVRYSENFTPSIIPFVTDVTTAALWHFNEIAGSTTFADSSANKNHLTAGSGATTLKFGSAPYPDPGHQQISSSSWRLYMPAILSGVKANKQ